MNVSMLVKVLSSATLIQNLIQTVFKYLEKTDFYAFKCWEFFWTATGNFLIYYLWVHSLFPPKDICTSNYLSSIQFQLRGVGMGKMWDVCGNEMCWMNLFWSFSKTFSNLYVRFCLQNGECDLGILPYMLSLSS